MRSSSAMGILNEVRLYVKKGKFSKNTANEVKFGRCGSREVTFCKYNRKCVKVSKCEKTSEEQCYTKGKRGQVQ